RAALLDAKQVYPASAEVAWAYGNFLLRNGQRSTGFAEIQRAVRADRRLGLQAYVICRHFEPDLDAIFDRVLVPSPDVYLNVAHYLGENGQLDECLKVWGKLVQLRPTLQTRDVIYFTNGLLSARRPLDGLNVWKQGMAFSGLVTN